MSDYNYDYVSDLKDLLETLDDSLESLKIDMKAFLTEYDLKMLNQESASQTVEYLIGRKIKNVSL